MPNNADGYSVVYTKLTVELVKSYSTRTVREASELKNVTKSEKVHNFLDPPLPRMFWTFLNLGKFEI